MKNRFGAVAAVVLAWIFSAGSVQSQTPSSSAYDGTKLAGSWVLTTKVALSTCSSQYVGKTGSNTWTITYSYAYGKVKAISDSKSHFMGDPPVKEGGYYKMYMYLNPTSKQAVYELTMQSSTKFTGKLISTTKDDVDGAMCVTLMDVELKKDSSLTPVVTSVRKFDWLNAKYTSGFYDGDYPVTLKNGKTSDGEYGIEVGYGDITGDGEEEAIVLWYWDASAVGGNGTGTPGLDIYSIVDGKFVILGSIESGLKGTNTIASIFVKGGNIVLKRNIWDGSDAQCCPSVLRTEEWGFQNSKITKLKNIKTETQKYDDF